MAKLKIGVFGAGRGIVMVRQILGNPDAELIPTVEVLTPEICALAEGKGSELGTGGMKTKLRAADIAMGAGIDMIIANGAEPTILYSIVDGKPFGTRFIGKKD